MVAAPLFQVMPASLATLYGTLDGHARAGAPVFAGSAGTVSQRTNQHGAEYHVHRYYDGAGRQRETYVGRAGDAEAESRVAVLQAQIAETKALLPDLRLLAREGFQVVDGKTYATLASLHLHGLFAAGATLIGSHAFGVMVNQLGVRAAAYATEDVDVARREALAFPSLPAKNFLEMLRDSGIDFVEVPELDSRQPSSSFKQRGVSRFHVDLLVPSDDAEIRMLPVPELKAHATALPFLSYLLGQTQMATLLSREGCCPVRIPVPERFAIHKLVVSQLRSDRSARSTKDMFQSAVILAVLGERFPGAIEAGVADLPVSARKQLLAAAKVMLGTDDAGMLTAYPRAAEELAGAVRALATRSRKR